MAAPRGPGGGCRTLPGAKAGPAGPSPSPICPPRPWGLRRALPDVGVLTCAAARAAGPTCSLLSPHPPRVQLRWDPGSQSDRLSGVTFSPLGAGRCGAPVRTGRGREGVDGRPGQGPPFRLRCSRSFSFLPCGCQSQEWGPARHSPLPPAPSRPHCGFPVNHTGPPPSTGLPAPRRRVLLASPSPSSPVSGLGRQLVPGG